MSSPTLPSLLLAAALLPATATAASAQDDVVATTKAPVQWVKVLDDAGLVATDRPRSKPNRVQRLLDGRLRPADHLTEPGLLIDVERPGLRGGRVVVPFLRAKGIDRQDRLVGRRWFLYDLRKDTAKRLRSIPGTAEHVAVDRGHTAYQTGRGVFYDGERVSKLRSDDVDDPLLLRDDTLVFVDGRGDGVRSISSLVVDGEPRYQPFATGDADHEYTVTDAWLNDDRMDWWMEASDTGGNLVLSADPADVNTIAPYPTLTERPLAYDGDDVYTLAADRRTIHRRAAGEPTTAPPANDAPANAQVLTGALPMTLGVRIGYATRTPDEPAVTGYTRYDANTGAASRTVWYAYTPVKSEQLTISGFGQDYLTGDLPMGAMSVYDDTGKELAKEQYESRLKVTFDAKAGHRYLIGVGADTGGPAFPTFTLRIAPGMA